jgi:Kae1-associated kinase Bud32
VFVNNLFMDIVCAEAKISLIDYDGKKAILKKRLFKNYRNDSLNNLLIKKRTRSEVKILTFLKNIINVPNVYSYDDSQIIMEYLNGDILKNVIKKNLCFKIGQEIRKIHKAGIIHGDLTTSNILVLNKKLYFIDFGLSFHSKKLEDFAMDLVVFKKVFNSTHSKINGGFDLVLKGYSPSSELITQMEKIEKRSRYH